MTATISTWIGSSILTVVTLILFFRLGFSEGVERAKAWLALTVLYALWGVELVVLGRETFLTALLMAALFFVISMHRFRIENPTGKVARFYDRNRWVPRIQDRK